MVLYYHPFQNFPQFIVVHIVSDSLQPHGLYNPWNSLSHNTGVGRHSFFQGIFPTQGLNPCLLHCRQILYQLSHKGRLPPPTPTRSVGVQYTTGDEWRNNSRKNEGMEPKQIQHPVVDVTGDGSKVRCCKEQYCIGTWNVRSMNHGKLEVIKQEMARVNVAILGISKLRWNL